MDGEGRRAGTLERKMGGGAVFQIERDVAMVSFSRQFRTGQDRIEYDRTGLTDGTITLALLSRSDFKARFACQALRTTCLLIMMCQGGLCIRNAFTDCSVARLGLASCLDARIQPRRWRMNCLSIAWSCWRPM